MFSYHKITSVVIGVLFLIVLQSFAVPLPVFRFLVPAFSVYALGATLYNYFYLLSVEKYNFWVCIKPTLLMVSGFSLFVLLPNSFLRSAFLLFTVVLLSFFEMFLGNFSENIQLSEALLTVFSVFVSVCAYNQYFPPYQFLYIAVLFFAAFIVTRSFFESIPQPEAVKRLHSVGIALFVTEVYWALTFLPFHYSAIALILFNLYYFMIALDYYHFFNILNAQKLKFHFILLACFTFAIFIATPWKIIN
jgi:hypothetical protein